MMPNLGQGGCQAMEDVDVLVDELCGVNNKKQIPDALQRYYRRRIVRSAIVQGMSRASSDIIISSFSTPFSLKEFLSQGWNYKYLTMPSLMTWNMQWFLPLIFYAQFGYLYTYAPSLFKSERIKELVKNSLLRNEAEANEVYKHVKNDTVTYFSAKKMSFLQFDRKTRESKVIATADEFRKSLADAASKVV